MCVSLCVRVLLLSVAKPLWDTFPLSVQLEGNLWGPSLPPSSQWPVNRMLHFYKFPLPALLWKIMKGRLAPCGVRWESHQGQNVPSLTWFQANWWPTLWGRTTAHEQVLVSQPISTTDVGSLCVNLWIHSRESFTDRGRIWARPSRRSWRSAGKSELKCKRSELETIFIYSYTSLKCVGDKYLKLTTTHQETLEALLNILS